MTTKITLGIVGASGFGREVMPYARDVAKAKLGAGGVTVETVFIETHPKHKNINGVPVLSEEDFFGLKSEQKYFNVAVADPNIREAIVGRFKSKGALPFTLQGPNTLIMDGNSYEEGMILCPFSTITSNIKIGKFFHSNIYSYIGHDCVLGDYVTFAPRVNCNGNVHIGNHVYIGTAAIIRQGTPDAPLVIGDGAVIGMGAVVTKNVPPGVTVVGNPARPFEKKT